MARKNILKTADGLWLASHYNSNTSGVWRDLVRGNHARVSSAMASDFLSYDGDPHFYFSSQSATSASWIQVYDQPITMEPSIDLRFRVDPTDWTPTSDVILAHNLSFDFVGGAFHKRDFYIDTTGKLGFDYEDFEETNQSVLSDSAVSFASGSGWVRVIVTFTATEVKAFFYEGGQGSDPAWLQIGSPVTVPTASTGLAAKGHPDLGSWGVIKTNVNHDIRLYRGIIYQGGNLVVDVDPSTLTHEEWSREPWSYTKDTSQRVYPFLQVTDNNPHHFKTVTRTALKQSNHAFEAMGDWSRGVIDFELLARKADWTDTGDGYLLVYGTDTTKDIAWYLTIPAAIPIINLDWYDATAAVTQTHSSALDFLPGATSYSWLGMKSFIAFHDPEIPEVHEDLTSVTATSHTVNWVSPASGNYLVTIMTFGSALSAAPTMPAGWTTALSVNEPNGSAFVIWKKSDGTEAAVTVTTSTSVHSAMRSYEIADLPATGALKLVTSRSGFIAPNQSSTLQASDNVDKGFGISFAAIGFDSTDAISGWTAARGTNKLPVRGGFHEPFFKEYEVRGKAKADLLTATAYLDDGVPAVSQFSLNDELSSELFLVHGMIVFETSTAPPGVHHYQSYDSTYWEPLHQVNAQAVSTPAGSHSFDWGRGGDRQFWMMGWPEGTPRVQMTSMKVKRGHQGSFDVMDFDARNDRSWTGSGYHPGGVSLASFPTYSGDRKSLLSTTPSVTLFNDASADATVGILNASDYVTRDNFMELEIDFSRFDVSGTGGVDLIGFDTFRVHIKAHADQNLSVTWTDSASSDHTEEFDAALDDNSGDTVPGVMAHEGMRYQLRVRWDGTGTYGDVAGSPGLARISAWLRREGNTSWTLLENIITTKGDGKIKAPASTLYLGSKSPGTSAFAYGHRFYRASVDGTQVFDGSYDSDGLTLSGNDETEAFDPVAIQPVPSASSTPLLAEVNTVMFDGVRTGLVRRHPRGIILVNRPMFMMTNIADTEIVVAKPKNLRYWGVSPSGEAANNEGWTLMIVYQQFSSSYDFQGWYEEVNPPIVSVESATVPGGFTAGSYTFTLQNSAGETTTFNCSEPELFTPIIEVWRMSDSHSTTERRLDQFHNGRLVSSNVFPKEAGPSPAGAPWRFLPSQATNRNSGVLYGVGWWNRLLSDSEIDLLRLELNLADADISEGVFY